MRRHLAVLVNTGLILRRDSPNGKRYVKRQRSDKQAFGFDLTPLVVRFAEFCATAEEIRAKEDRHQRLRRSVSLMRRDLAGLAAYGAESRQNERLWDAHSDLALLTARDLRRNLSYEDLEQLEAKLNAALEAARNVFDLVATVKMVTNDAQNEHHHQNSDKDSNVLESTSEAKKVERIKEAIKDYTKLPNIPLQLVLDVCQEMNAYTPDKIRHWHHLVRTAEIVRPMMGISTSAWNDAIESMGPEEASVVVVSMLERFKDIQSPGGYLRALTRKAEQGGFSCGPMVMALMRQEAA